MLFLAAVKIATSVRYFLSPFNSEAKNLTKTATLCAKSRYRLLDIGSESGTVGTQAFGICSRYLGSALPFQAVLTFCFNKTKH